MESGGFRVGLTGIDGISTQFSERPMFFLSLPFIVELRAHVGDCVHSAAFVVINELTQDAGARKINLH